MRDQILVREEICGIPFHVDEAMTDWVSYSVTAQHKTVFNRLLVSLEQLIKFNVRKVSASRQTTAEIT